MCKVFKLLLNKWLINNDFGGLNGDTINSQLS